MNSATGCTMTIAPIAGPLSPAAAQSDGIRDVAPNQLDAAAFSHALSAQAGKTGDASGLSTSAIIKLASASEAADNAWVTVMSLLEKLQSPDLGQTQTKAILGKLSASYREFQVQSQPIAQLLNRAAGGE